MIKSLYRFFPYNAHDLDALANNYLWFSSYSDFNDPFEDLFVQNALQADLGEYDQSKVIAMYKALHKGDIPSEQVNQALTELIVKNELREHYEQHMKNAVAMTQKELSAHINDTKACCLVSDNIDENELALENKLMWSHYGNGMRGFCVEYDYSELVYSLSVASQQNVGLCPMEYQVLQKNSFIDLFIGTAERDGSSKNLGSLVATKSVEWAYENEFRLILKSTGNVNYFNPAAIKSITYGEKMPESKLVTLLSVLNGNVGIECDVYKAYIDVESFQIKRKHHSRTV
ncbi:DUF2971 domain-containing protein [Vibrio vulnificus]|uniref:DUF2971 domain-containing protein n=1 Tax=Vibrio vulnificus TaxID=672 RepID=UPI001EEA74D5|nr:DUF2971 domain-containing protein [Vibrio vulnificus]MCG6270634.1 DUF2971 domain-containing protein [Vibrio vulnificus]